MTPTLPQTMKAAVATGFGEIDGNIFVRTDWPVPSSPPPPEHLVVRVLACALAPGDVRVLSGKTDFVQLPESGHPYVIGSDVSGVVVSCHENETKFQPGDYVVCRFDEPKPNGGVAEYHLVKTKLTEKCPSSIPPIVSCGLPASAMAAKLLAGYVQPKDRVLVIGGSGAVGSSVIQYVKAAGASYIVAVSTQSDFCQSLGADRVLDYRVEEPWWQQPDFKKDKFNVVIDMVNGDNWTTGGCSALAVESTGTYVAAMTGVETELEAHGWTDFIKLGLTFMGRMLYSRIHFNLPKWVAPEALKLEDGDLAELFQDVVKGELKPVMDPSSPFPFTEEGVRQAMHLQQSRHAHGKVVIQVSDDLNVE